MFEHIYIDSFYNLNVLDTNSDEPTLKILTNTKQYMSCLKNKKVITENYFKKQNNIKILKQNHYFTLQKCVQYAITIF